MSLFTLVSCPSDTDVIWGGGFESRGPLLISSNTGDRGQPLDGQPVSHDRVLIKILGARLREASLAGSTSSIWSLTDVGSDSAGRWTALPLVLLWILPHVLLPLADFSPLAIAVMNHNSECTAFSEF